MLVLFSIDMLEKVHSYNTFLYLYKQDTQAKKVETSRRGRDVFYDMNELCVLL